jgi:hypothetical protein
MLAPQKNPQTVPGFQDAIRGYVLHSVGITFRRVHTRVLGEWLRLEGPALQALLAEKVRGGEEWAGPGRVVVGDSGLNCVWASGAGGVWIIARE